MSFVITCLSTRWLTPVYPPTSSSVVKVGIIDPPNFTPVSTNALNEKMVQAFDPFMSAAPHHKIYPFRITGLNGLSVHPDGYAGTTSKYPLRSIYVPSPSLFRIVYNFSLDSCSHTSL